MFTLTKDELGNLLLGYFEFAMYLCQYLVFCWIFMPQQSPRKSRECVGTSVRKIQFRLKFWIGCLWTLPMDMPSFNVLYIFFLQRMFTTNATTKQLKKNLDLCMFSSQIQWNYRQELQITCNKTWNITSNKKKMVQSRVHREETCLQCSRRHSLTLNNLMRRGQEVVNPNH
jgi:hypothetical protein